MKDQPLSHSREGSPPGQDGPAQTLESLQMQVTALRAQNQRLEESGRATAEMLLELASGLSHELSQPLSAIIAYTSAQRHLLQAGSFSPEQLARGLQKTAAQAERAAEFIRRFRGLIRRALPQPKSGTLAAIAARTLARLDAALAQAQVQVRTAGLDTVPQVWVDAEQLQQVFVQLLCNSIEALEASGSAVREVSIHAIRKGSSVEVTVRDSGPGFDAQEVDSIFMPFVTTKRDHLGLGLSLARSLIDAQHGKLWAESDDAGAQIKFIVPIEPVRQ